MTSTEFGISNVYTERWYVESVGNVRIALMSSKMKNVVRWVKFLEDTDCGG